MNKKVTTGVALTKGMSFIPEAGHGADQLVAFAARQRVLDVARTRTKEDQQRLKHEMQASGFNISAFRIAVKRRNERAIGMPFAQLTPIPEKFKDVAQRYENILMHADQVSKDRNAI